MWPQCFFLLYFNPSYFITNMQMALIDLLTGMYFYFAPFQWLQCCHPSYSTLQKCPWPYFINPIPPLLCCTPFSTPLLTLFPIAPLVLSSAEEFTRSPRHTPLHATRNTVCSCTLHRQWSLEVTWVLKIRSHESQLLLTRVNRNRFLFTGQKKRWFI